MATSRLAFLKRWNCKPFGKEMEWGLLLTSLLRFRGHGARRRSAKRSAVMNNEISYHQVITYHCDPF